MVITGQVLQRGNILIHFMILTRFLYLMMFLLSMYILIFLVLHCLSWHAYNPLQKGRLFHVVGTFRMHKEYWEFIKAARELTRKLQASCDAFGKSIMKKLQIGRLHQLHGHKFLFFKDNFKPP